MAKKERLPIAVETFGEIVILRLEADVFDGSCDLDSVRDKITAAIAPRSRVVVDLAHVDYLSSVGASLLVCIHAHSRRNGGRMIFCGLTPMISEVLHLNRLDRLFQIVPSLADSLAALDWSIAIGCPIKGCEGDALSHDPSITDRGGDLRCRSCGCRFRVAPVQRSPDGEARFAVSRFEVPTYEQEQICAELGDIAHLHIVGRLDLFAAEALVDTWRSLPPPRRGLVDLSAATELSVAGLRLLGTHFREDLADDRVVVLVDPDRFDPTRAGLSGIQVTTTQNEALSILGGAPGLDETPAPLLVPARPVTGTAGESRPSGAGRSAAEDNPEKGT